jgi:hypothetical protein
MTIRGIDVFRSYFAEYKEQYVLIGGAACDLVLAGTGIASRVTKDLDIVLIVEALTPEFGERMWQFIRDGGYRNRARSDGSFQYYRFDSPQSEEFPFMIEILSGKEDVLPSGGDIVSLTLGDSLSSLSAILLDHEYYRLLFDHRETVSDIVILPAECLIPFKAKAWLDLTSRKQSGEHVNSRDISKHMSDIIRLVAALPGAVSCELPSGVLDDMNEFIRRMESHPFDPKSMGIKGIDAGDILSVLRRVYGLNS